jgi:hypothetical protein
MEPEVLLLCSQESSYPEPEKSSPHLPTMFLFRSIVLLSSHVRLGLPNGLFLSGFPTKIFMRSSHSCYMPRPYHLPLFDRPNNIL